MTPAADGLDARAARAVTAAAALRGFAAAIEERDDRDALYGLDGLASGRDPALAGARIDAIAEALRAAADGLAALDGLASAALLAADDGLAVAIANIYSPSRIDALAIARVLARVLRVDALRATADGLDDLAVLAVALADAHEIKARAYRAAARDATKGGAS